MHAYPFALGHMCFFVGLSQEQAVCLELACRGEIESRQQVEALLHIPAPARDSAGKPVNPRLQRSGGWLLTAILLVLAGCTAYRTEPPQATANVPLLAPLQSGITTRQELAKDWGPPSASLQQGRIVFYRLEGNGNSLRFSEETGSWRRSRHSVVLIFSSTGLLEKSSFVRIR